MYRNVYVVIYVFIHRVWASLVAQTIKILPASAGDLGWVPGLGRSPGEGNGNPLQCSCPENSTDRGALWTTQSVGSRRIGQNWAAFPFTCVRPLNMSVLHM